MAAAVSESMYLPEYTCNNQETFGGLVVRLLQESPSLSRSRFPKYEHREVASRRGCEEGVS